MKTMRIEIALVLSLALAVTAVSAVAGETELPAESQRIWAPTGDLIGLRSHVTGTYQGVDTCSVIRCGFSQVPGRTPGQSFDIPTESASTFSNTRMGFAHHRGMMSGRAQPEKVPNLIPI